MEDQNKGMGIDGLYTNVERIINEARDKVYQAANFAMVQSYWHIGKLIVEEEQHGKGRAAYGKLLIKMLSKRLGAKYGKGYTPTNLWYMRQFYNAFGILHAVRGELSWTHYRLLLKIERVTVRNFYIDETVKCNWSTRTLERQINSFYFERILVTPKENRPLVKQEAENNKIEMQARDVIKDPYVLEFLDLKPGSGFYETELEQAIIDKLQDFLLELGKGFSFVRRQYRINVEGDYFYVDLVFYNYILKCFLLIDLKRGKLSHQDVGQMDMYVRCFDNQMRQENDGPAIGLILFTEANRAVAKYSLLNNNKQIFASEYMTFLPTEEELEKVIGNEIDLVAREKKFNEMADQKNGAAIKDILDHIG